jgi:hypothetical protein
MLKEENKVETREPRCGRTSVPVARIGSPLLLKTNLPRPPRHTQGCNRTNLAQYSGLETSRQRFRVKP